MKEHIRIYLITIVVFLIIDMIWLGYIAVDLYQEQIGFLLKTEFNWTAAFTFYALYIIALIFFVIKPAIRKQSFSYALGAGAFFGFITYATYDLTNLATIEGWPIFITVIDLIWGAFICGATASISYYFNRRISIK